LHAAVVELVALDGAEIKYSTVQNWYPGNKEGKGGVYNFVTKRGCEANAKILDTRNRICCDLEISFMYLKGDNSVENFIL
jgi:Fe-S cluster assembly protein SufB